MGRRMLRSHVDHHGVFADLLELGRDLLIQCNLLLILL
jgi:hypothetical protein